MNCKKIEAKGIKTVLVTDEYAGRDGTSQSLADAEMYQLMQWFPQEMQMK